MFTETVMPGALGGLLPTLVFGPYLNLLGGCGAHGVRGDHFL